MISSTSKNTVRSSSNLLQKTSDCKKRGARDPRTPPPPPLESATGLLLEKSKFFKGDYALGYVSTQIFYNKVLSRSATRTPSLLYYISSFLLLGVNRICTKIWQSSEML